MKIVFKNLESSELAKDIVEERLGDMLEKFPRLHGHKITVTLFMENSSRQPGPDSFGVKVRINGEIYRDMSLTKSAPSLYRALADVREHLLELLNRATDRMRVVERSKERKLRAAV